jgi:hypothetical protein
MQTFTVEKSNPKMWATLVIFCKLPKEYNHPLGEKFVHPIWSPWLCDALKSWWPDWANFQLLGDRLLWVVFVQITEVAQIIGLDFHNK